MTRHVLALCASVAVALWAAALIGDNLAGFMVGIVGLSVLPGLTLYLIGKEVHP